MTTDFYTKLSDMNLLRRAWHLARKDSRSDFMLDPYRYSDFAFRLDDHLHGISESLSTLSYHPKPLLTIDVPKSSLAVRPGSVLEIEDRVVLFAIARLIAPHLDRLLPPGVCSWRVKKKAEADPLFEDHEVLRFPFLKRRTIQKRIEFVEPWYEGWPRFMRKLEFAYEKQGYRFLVVSDIVAYFENIDHSLLRDLLLQHLPRQRRIIEFLVSLLEFWAWQTVGGVTVPRGIPQGNSVSSFIGNIYLLPVDFAFSSLVMRRDLKYFRYMDDVKVLAKDNGSAREALFLMNERLRALRLNIQGAKTEILKGAEIRGELFDERLDQINKVVDALQKRRRISERRKKDYSAELRGHLRSIKGKKAIIQGKDLRIFRRLMTAFKLLGGSAMVRLTLDQLERNPDYKLVDSAGGYLRVQERNLKKIADRLTHLLTSDPFLFAYQKASFFSTMRYMRQLPPEAWNEARHQLKLKRAHWYVRQQAAALLALKKLRRSELRSVERMFEKEQNAEVKRALLQSLTQLPRKHLGETVRQLLFVAHPKLQRVGRFFYGVLFDRNKGEEQVKSIFSDFREDTLLERLFEVQLLSNAKDITVRKRLLDNLVKHRKEVHRPLLRMRLSDLVQQLQQATARQNVDVVKAPATLRYHHSQPNPADYSCPYRPQIRK